MRSCALKSGGYFTTKDFEEGVQTLDTGHYRYVTRSKQLFWGTESFLFVILNYLRTEAPPFWCKRTCCIETFGHVRPKVSYIFRGINFCSRKLLVCIVVFNGTSFLALFRFSTCCGRGSEGSNTNGFDLNIHWFNASCQRAYFSGVHKNGISNSAFHWFSKRILVMWYTSQWLVVDLTEFETPLPK